MNINLISTTMPTLNRIYNSYKPKSKHRPVEKEYWLNKLVKRKRISKIQKASRKRNSHS